MKIYVLVSVIGLLLSSDIMAQDSAITKKELPLKKSGSVRQFGKRKISTQEKSGSGIQFSKRKVSTYVKVSDSISVEAEIESSERSVKAIKKILHRKREGLRYLYNKRVNDGFTSGGEVTMKMTIAPGGKIVDVSIIKSEFTHKSFNDELLKRVKRWKFQKAPRGMTNVICSYDFFIK